MRRLLASLLLAAVWTVAPRISAAHEMSIAELDVREIGPGDFLWDWAASNDRASPGEGLAPRWPERCGVDGNLLHCGPQGLAGTLTIDGVGERYSATIVRIHWGDGQSSVYTLTSAQPQVQLFGSADDRRSWTEIGRIYLILGVEHILSGYDHLAFVFGLLFLVGFRRQLVWTITAFTAAHSLTLASAALGWLTLRPPPVEATIALSIVLVASEALNPRLTVARRWPAAIAFLFGLVHGLGFAGALKEIGLPQGNLAAALVSFNVGVELGQLACVGLASLLWFTVLSRLPWARRARTPALYGIGTVAAYWSWLRVVALLG